MSTRRGTLVFLEDVLQRAIELAEQTIREKPDLKDKETVARQVGVGAVIFGDLSNDRIKDIDFEWEKVLDFSGETAPSSTPRPDLQYTAQGRELERL